MRIRGLGCALVFLAAAVALGAEEGPLLRAEFWIDLEPVAAPGDPWPVPADIAGQRLLEEASWVYGGMVWGFDFEYVPLDRTRKIEELLRLTPLGSIAWGDQRLKPGKLEPRELGLFEPSELHAFVEYRLDVASAAFMDSYSRVPWVRAQGIGKADLIKGWPGRRMAYEDALREAVRAYLRSIEPNKPRRATGRVVFDRVPSIMIKDGFYVVQARARIDVRELAPYVVY